MRPFVAAAAALLIGSAGLHASSLAAATAQSAPAETQWMRGEGLRTDPELRFGALPNGMRYVIRRNKTPAGEASVRLRIATGSLNEAEDQRGIAHFLEHMVLNGTKNVPEGEFVRRLERHGLRFGPDTNASTDFGQTVYKLDLPETDEDTVNEALFLLREVADRAMLDPAAIERERGIILSEERVRATPAYRQALNELTWLYPGQLLPTRLPIGDTGVIRTASRERFVQFYQAWYRPERATFVIVGDIDPDAIEAKIAKQFGDWRGEGPPGTHPEQGRPQQRGLAASVFIDPAIAAGVRINWIRPADLEPDSLTKRKRDLEEALAIAVLNRRLEKLAQAERNPPFVSARLTVSELQETAETSTLSAVARLGDWKTALSAMEQEQRRLVQHGITPDELERELIGYRAALEAGVASADTRTSPSLAEAVIGAVDRGNVVTAPADRLAFFEEAVKEITPARVHATARTLFAGSGPLLYLTLPRPAPGVQAALLSTFAAAQKVAVRPPVAQPMVAWPYGSFGAPGTLAERRDFPAIGATAVRFANGVRLIVRPNQNRKEQILTQVRFGNGRLAIDPGRLSPEWALGQGLTFGGTTKLDADSINRALTGKLVGTGFDTADDRFVLTGGTRPADFATQMQLLAAFVTDPGWRPLGWERLKATANNIHDRFESTPGGILQRDSGVLLRSGDRRWELPSRTAMRTSSIAQARALLDPALRNGAIEVIVVGDTTVDEAIKQTAATFGALPPRAEAKPPIGTMRFPAPTATPVTLFHKGRADQAVAFLAWPTVGYSRETRQLSRTLALLGSVLQLRLTDRLRETEGVSYSPGAGHAASATWTNYGYMAAQIEAPPEKLDAFFGAAQEIAGDLAAKPIDEDELTRARRPLLENIQRAREGNEFWLSALDELGTDPLTLESILTQQSDLQAITPVQLQETARRYLVPATAYRIKVVKGTPLARKD